MADIVRFRPRKELDAEAQVEHFIQFCRYELTVWEEHIDWEAIEWNLTASITKTGRKHKNALQWTKMSETRRGRSSGPMAQPFGDFSRAFIRNYRVEEDSNSFHTSLSVLRVLEIALLDLSPDGEVRVERTDSAVLNRCAKIIKERYEPSTQYEYASAISLIHRFLVANGMVNNPCDWDNPFPYKAKNIIGTDDEIIANRNKKLPTEAAYDALLEINGKNETGELSSRDQVITSNAMVCCANPDRSAEIATARRDLMRAGHAIGNRTKLFLAWYPVKGGKPLIKPVPAQWEKVTRKAIERLQKLSAPAREMAIWYEKHPDQIYLPPEYEHLRERKWLTANEVQTLLGIASTAISNKYTLATSKDAMKDMVQRELEPNWTKGPNPPYRYDFAGFQRYVLGELPEHFPLVDPDGDLKYSDMLNIYPVGMLNTQASGSLDNCSLVMFDWFDAAAFAAALSGRKGKKNMFARHGYFENKARTKPLKIRTHELRHMDVTMAQEAGLSDVEMAKLRGSDNVAQTNTYKHLTLKERSKAIGWHPEKGTTQRDDGLMVIKPISELEIKEMRKRGHLQLHENRYGLCAHPIEQEPCPRFLDCLGCTEQLCKVGDEEKTQRIEEVVQGAKDCLANAEEYKQEDEEEGYETSDADPWIRTQKATIESGEALLAVLRNSKIPEGTWVKRTGPNRYDPYVEMVTARAELTGTEEDKKLLARMTPLALPGPAEVA